MTRLAFIVPCHGRHKLATICLTQLRSTCDALGENGIEASVVLVSDDDRFERLARELDFAHKRQANSPLGRKWNDGYEHAAKVLDADVFVPFGSDDIVDPDFILRGGMPTPMTLRCARESSVVDPTGRKLAKLAITYPGGDGVRLIPRDLIDALGCRPVDDKRERAIDGSMTTKIRQITGRRPQLAYFDLHAAQIVDFKSKAAGQLNRFDACADSFGVETVDAMAELERHFPAAFVTDIRGFYRL